MYLRIGDISWVPDPFGDSAHAYFKDFIGAKIAASIVLAWEIQSALDALCSSHAVNRVWTNGLISSSVAEWVVYLLNIEF